MNLDLSWRRLLHGLDDSELSFSLRVITNTLPTPNNLRRWGELGGSEKERNFLSFSPPPWRTDNRHVLPIVRPQSHTPPYPEWM